MLIKYGKHLALSNISKPNTNHYSFDLTSNIFLLKYQSAMLASAR